MAYKALLLDVDGVLLQPPEKFSAIYSRKYNVPLEQLLPFFHSTEFHAAATGHYDLVQAIRDHNDKWQWPGEPKELLEEWFQTECVLNDELLEVAKGYRSRGVRIAIVTQQEPYRAGYLKKHVFSGMFDDFFVSCEIGHHKKSPEFWQEIIGQLKPIQPHEMLFVDDKEIFLTPAKSLGIDTQLYRSADHVRQTLAK